MIIVRSLAPTVIILIAFLTVFFILKQIRGIATKLEKKEDERHEALLKAIRNNRTIIYRRSSYGIRKQRRY